MVLKNSEKPVVAILGGSKVSSKITVIENILDKVNHMIIGGGMTFTFIKALGGKIGNSICEDDKLEIAIEILKQAKEKGVQIHLPVDVVAADSFSNDAKTQIVDVNQIPEEIKHKRFDRLKALFESQVEENNKKYIGTIQKILVEGLSKTNANMLTGRTNSNKVVVFEGDESLVGQVVEVKIISEHKWYLKGEKNF